MEDIISRLPGARSRHQIHLEVKGHSMKRHPNLFISLLVALSLFWGCAKTETPKSTQQASSGTITNQGNVFEVTSVEKRSPKVPNFSWKDGSGATVTFDQFRGKATLINFWATWCGPCKKELPDLVALSNELAPKNAKILGVSVDRAPGVTDLVRSFTSEHGITYPVLIANDDMEDAFGNPRLIPTSYLIDSSGNIAQTIVGLHTKDFYQQAITSLLKN